MPYIFYGEKATPEQLEAEVDFWLYKTDVPWVVGDDELARAKKVALKVCDSWALDKINEDAELLGYQAAHLRYSQHRYETHAWVCLFLAYERKVGL